MGCWKANAKSEFDGWSASYDRSVLQRIFFRPSHDKLFQTLELQAGSHVLDVGCGTGLFAGRMLVENPDVTVVGLDISDKMLEKAAVNCEAMGDRAEFVLGDSEHLPFDNDTFDAVTCVHSFHHYPHQGRVLREMHRVLKPGGQLVIVDANRDHFWGWLVFDWVVTTLEGLVHHCSGRQFRELFDLAGFEEIGQTTGGHVAPFMVTRGIASKPDSAMRSLRAA